jgi:signal transduction histidine kinase
VWTYRESGRALRDAAQRVNFVNQVSHELKTPLTNVRLYAELLEEQLPEEDAVARRRLEVLLGECRRLSRLIANVLTFAREGRRGAAPASDPVSVDDVVRDLVEQFAPAFQARGVRVDLAAGAPRPVGVDADALAQIVGNLFGNVEKYAPCAPLAVRTHQEPGRVHVAVHDGGPGIPVAARERVFEPFVRLGGEGLEAVPGTGIGLGIARDLARAHGGDLRIVPAERGACFEVTLAVKELP